MGENTFLGPVKHGRDLSILYVARAAVHVTVFLIEVPGISSISEMLVLTL